MLRLEKINKIFGDFALKNIDLTINKGDYFVLIGKSGAGKSMLLDIITGLIKPDSGRIFLDDRNLLDIPIQHRKIGIVYQKPTLFPHMTVYGNIAYPLKIRKLARHEIKLKINEIASLLDISHLLDRSITNLSGGEAQRVTIARTLVTNPEVLLLDEPLTYLDVNLRRDMSKLLKRLNSNGQTIVHVTHDYESALSITNSIAIIDNGEIIQNGTVHEVFQNPKSSFIAEFIGLKNLSKGYITLFNSNPSHKVFKTSELVIDLGSNFSKNSTGYIIIPDEAIEISVYQSEKTTNSFGHNGRVTDIYQTNIGLEIIIDIGIEICKQITNHDLQSMDIKIGSILSVNIDPNQINFVNSN